MASLLRSVFGTPTQTEEEKKNEPNPNNNSNPSNQAPTKKPLSKQELADKRLGKLEAAIMSQPATCTAEPTESPPNKKRKTENNEIGALTNEMKMSMKLSKQTDTKNEFKNEISADISYEYLTVMYILEIRHNNLSEYNKYISNMNEFKPFLSSNIDKYCIIHEETPISSSTIEAIFIDRFQHEFAIYKSSFKYLLQSYQRCIDFETRINNYWTAIIAQKDQLQIVANIQTCILTFCQILLSTPDLTTMQDFLKSQQEFQHILNSRATGRDFPKGFLTRLFEQIDDDSIGDVLDKCMNSIKTISLNVLRSNFSPATNALIKLSQIEKFALYLMDETKPFWIPNENNMNIIQIKSNKINAHNIIVESVMGGLLNLSFETPDITGLFNKLSMKDIQNNPQLQQNIHSSVEEYRLIINESQNGIYCIFNNFVRIKNKKCKENVLRLLSYFIYINLDRGKIRFDHKIVSTDGFMLNLNYLLLKLCEPIIKRNLLNKINTRYFLIKKSTNYMSWQEATRLSANNQQIQLLTDKLYESEQKADTEPSFGFTTEIFCLTLEALHLGFSCVANEFHRLQRHIERLRREARANPVAGYLIDINIQRLEKRLLAQFAHIMDPRFMLMVGSFYGFFCKYLLYLSTHSNGEELSSIIPEYFIEDLSRFFQVFLTERGFVALIQRGQSPFNREEVIKCLIYLMSYNTPIKNIYQRACLCEVLLLFLPAKVIQSKRNANIVWSAYEFESHEFNRFESCKKKLVATLLTLYSDVERTGSPGQYYEKFKFRTIITKILKFLFSYKIHQNNLILFWQKQEEEFIAFLNMLINDLIYTLDHGFDGLTEIRQIESEPEPNPNSNSQNAWNPMEPQQNEAMQRQENISQLKDTIRHHMNLANESIELLKYVCYHTPEPFMDNLILPRIAVLVSVYLDRLAKGSELRVKGNLREDYNFNAKFLLTSVVNIFNKLCSNHKTKELFLDAIVEDEAHFREMSYKKGINVLRKKGLMNMNDINLFEQTLSILLQKFQEKKNMEFMLGEIPIKYLDPIMQTLMSDPVILGNKNKKDKNRYVMDRKVIERHLMNNPSNPFNREPLSKNDLIPDIELKNEIDEWVKTTLEKHKYKNKDNDEQKEQ